WGHWSGCHATPINAEAPDYGRRDLTDKTNRLSYTYGVMLNVEGKRWIDEGADFNSYTYAKYGGLILKQPRSLIYQIFDSKVLDMLEPRYSTTVPFKSDTLEGLVKQLQVDLCVANCWSSCDRYLEKAAAMLLPPVGGELLFRAEKPLSAEPPEVGVGGIYRISGQ